MQGIKMKKTNVNNVSIVIPAHNEEKNIPPIIKRISKSIPDVEIIIVDDHSTDNTQEIIKRLQKKYKTLRLLKKKGPKGKTTSLLQGFVASKGDILVMIDADLQYPPEAIPRMIKQIEEDKADIVIAKRIMRLTLRSFFSHCFTSLFGRLLLGIPASDIQTGEKVFRREVIDSISITSKSWGFDIEFLYKAKEKGYKIAEIPIAFSQRAGGATKVNVLYTIYDLALTSFKLMILH